LGPKKQKEKKKEKLRREKETKRRGGRTKNGEKKGKSGNATNRHRKASMTRVAISTTKNKEPKSLQGTPRKELQNKHSYMGSHTWIHLSLDNYWHGML